MSADAVSARYGFAVVLTGIIAVLLITAVAILRWSSAAEVATVISSAAGIIGTIVAAYFGVQVGASGKEKAEEKRDKAEGALRQVLGSLPPEQYDRLRTQRPELFQ